jgi:hypothetical protein
MSDQDPATIGDPSKPTADPVVTAPAAVDPMSLKFDGTSIPEKFRGKTAADVFKAYSEVETLANEKATLVSDWEKWYMKNHDPNKAAAEADPKEPLFDQEQLAVLDGLLTKQLHPITQALDNVFLDNIKAVVPDFGSFEKRAREIYDSMPSQFKYSPKHGWTFAYNMAKSEATGLPKGPPPPPISGSGPSAPPKSGTDLSDEELAWAKKQGMTEEEYKKYQTIQENA